jgi:hypothetical protein
VDELAQRRRRHRRLVTIVSVATAAAVLTGALAVRASLHGRSAPPPVSQGRTHRYVDRSFGWQIRYPRGWMFAPVQHQGYVTDGFRFTTFAPDLKLDTRVPACWPGCYSFLPSGPPGWDMAPQMGWLKAFPADGVAVQIWRGLLPGGISLHDSAFPVSAASFHRTQIFREPLGPEPFFRTIYGDGLEFAAAVWIGPRASGAHVRAAWAIVRSLRFSALTPGTNWQDMYYVLGPASRYPVGSVTAMPPPPKGLGFSKGPGQRDGFYLVRGPRAFYAVDMKYGESGSPLCSVAFDPRSRQFSCPGWGWHWNIMGWAVGVPPPASTGVDARLFTHAVIVTHDGQLLYAPWSAGYFRNPQQSSDFYWE